MKFTEHVYVLGVEKQNIGTKWIQQYGNIHLVRFGM